VKERAMVDVKAVRELWHLPQIAKEVDCIAPMIVELADLRDAEPRGSPVQKALDDAIMKLHYVMAQLYDREKPCRSVKIDLCPRGKPTKRAPAGT
jgi:hypothetical protein